MITNPIEEVVVKVSAKKRSQESCGFNQGVNKILPV